MTAPGRIMALDYGARRVGVALSDPLRLIAQPHTVIDRRNENLVERVRSIVAEYDVSEIVVGLPVTLAGQEGRSASEARRMADQVEAATGLPVTLLDERFTTVTAERALLEGGVRRRRRRRVLDKTAAAVLLKAYLDRQ